MVPDESRAAVAPLTAQTLVYQIPMIPIRTRTQSPYQEGKTTKTGVKAERAVEAVYPHRLLNSADRIMIDYGASHQVQFQMLLS